MLSIQFGAIQFNLNPFSFAIYLPCIHVGDYVVSLGTIECDRLDFEFSIIQCDTRCLFGVDFSPFNITVGFLFIEFFRKRR